MVLKLPIALKFFESNAIINNEPLGVDSSLDNPTTPGRMYKRNENSNSMCQFPLFCRDIESFDPEKYFHFFRTDQSEKTTRMYRALIVSVMVGSVLGGAVAPRNEISSHQSRQVQPAGPLTSTENNDDGPVYPGPSQQKSLLPSSQYFYPTYPEYPRDSGYAVQSGYEGYLIPSAPPRQTSTWSSGILSTLVPLSNFALTYGARATTYIWNLLILLVIGGAFTTAICTFTPFCTITFLGLGLNKNQVREQVSELARTYITPESMSTATLLVQKAIDKYAELQRQQREIQEQVKSEKNEKKDTKRRRR